MVKKRVRNPEIAPEVPPPQVEDDGSGSDDVCTDPNLQQMGTNEFLGY